MATLSALSQSPIVHKGTKYETAGLPYTVTDEILGYFQHMGWGSGTLDVQSGDTVDLSVTRREDGRTISSGGRWFVPANLAGYLKATDQASGVASSLTHSVKMVQANGKVLRFASALSIATYPFAVGCWMLEPSATAANQREWFQAFNSTIGRMHAQQTRFGTESGTVKHLSERNAAGTAYIPYWDNLDLYDRWILVVWMYYSGTDVRLVLNGVEQPAYPTTSNRDIFGGSGTVDDFYIFGKQYAGESPHKAYFSNFFLYNGRLPSASDLVELANALPGGVSNPPDNLIGLNNSLVADLGGVDLEDQAGGSYTFEVEAPRLAAAA